MASIAHGGGCGFGRLGGVGVSSSSSSTASPKRGGRRTATPSSARAAPPSGGSTTKALSPRSTRSPHPTAWGRTTSRPPTRVPWAEPSSLTTGPPLSRTRVCTRLTSGSDSRTVHSRLRPTVRLSPSTRTVRPASGPATTRTVAVVRRVRAGRRAPRGRHRGHLEHVTLAQAAVGQPPVGRPHLAVDDGDQERRRGGGAAAEVLGQHACEVDHPGAGLGVHDHVGAGQTGALGGHDAQSPHGADLQGRCVDATAAG